MLQGLGTESTTRINDKKSTQETKYEIDIKVSVGHSLSRLITHCVLTLLVWHVYGDR